MFRYSCHTPLFSSSSFFFCSVTESIEVNQMQMNQRENRRSVAIAQESQQKYIQGQSAMLILFVFLFFSFFVFFFCVSERDCLSPCGLFNAHVRATSTCPSVCVWIFKMVCAWLHVCLFVNLEPRCVYTLCTCFSCRGLQALTGVTTEFVPPRGNVRFAFRAESQPHTHTHRPAAQHPRATHNNAFVSR